MNKDYEDFSDFDDLDDMFNEDDEDDDIDFGGEPDEYQKHGDYQDEESSDENYYQDEEDYEEEEAYPEDLVSNQTNSEYDTSDEGIEEEVDENEPKPDMILYVVIDKYFEGMINYMRESGLNVSCIFKSISDARDELLMQTEPYRLVVIETGLGRFTSTNQRKELIDLLGVCTDEDSRASVFYTDSVLKIDVTRELGKNPNIRWDKYKNTALLVSKLLKMHENFILMDEQNSDELITFDSVKNFQGLSSREQTSKGVQPIITSESILKGMILDGNSEDLEGFDPEL